MKTLKPNYLKMTVARLQSYNDLKAKIQADLLDVADFKREGVAETSKDIVRICSTESGYQPSRLTAQEIHELKIDTLLKEIHENQREINRIDDLIEAMKDELYIDIIPLKYFKSMTEQAIALRLCCDVSTVYRHKNRLLRRFSIRMFGAKAVDSVAMQHHMNVTV